MGRNPEDKIAAVRTIHDHFFNICSKHYTPKLYVTVDEQIVSFRGGCPVKVYDPSKKKSNRFGIKQYRVIDAATNYILTPEIYISGWSPNNEPNYWSGESIVKRLVQHSEVPRGCGIFGDIFFTTHSLCEWAHEFDFTYVGTVSIAREFMPPCVKKSELKMRRLMRYESVVVYSDYASVIAYTSKDYSHSNFTPIYIMSSEHSVTFKGDKSKPNPMFMYDINKKGMDKGNQMLERNSVYRVSRRWSYRVFCNYLDIVAQNSWVVARHNNTDLQYPIRKSGRRRMLRELALQLSENCMQIRAQISGLPGQIRSDLNALGFQRQRPENDSAIQTVRRRGRCESCTVRPRKTTRKMCISCGRFVCLYHSMDIKVCCDCHPC